MPNLESCDMIGGALDAQIRAQAKSLARGLNGANAGDAAQRKTAEGFSSLFYASLVKQMQKTVSEGEDGDDPMTDGVRDMMGMFLPQTMAEAPGDPVTSYILDVLQGRGPQTGEGSDERG